MGLLPEAEDDGTAVRAGTEAWASPPACLWPGFLADRWAWAGPGAAVLTRQTQACRVVPAQMSEGPYFLSEREK